MSNSIPPFAVHGLKIRRIEGRDYDCPVVLGRFDTEADAHKAAREQSRTHPGNVIVVESYADKSYSATFLDGKGVE